MFIDLIDNLRCPVAHEDTWLVASVARTEGRHIMEGTLGCPVCSAEYPIHDGVVSFGVREQTRTRPGAEHTGNPAFALRLAALLDLSDSRGVAVLAGSFARYATDVHAAVETHLILVNPDSPAAVATGISILEVPDGIPLAEATCRGVALDATHATPSYLRAAVRVLRPRARLVAPARSPTPRGVTEVARDEHLWVAERDVPLATPIPLRGRRPAS